MPAAEHATLLLYLAAALTGEEAPTPFRHAVRTFLAHRSLDPDRLSSALDELVTLCLGTDGEGEAAAAVSALPESLLRQEGLDAAAVLRSLQEWRSTPVPSKSPSPAPSGTNGASESQAKAERRSAFGKYAGIIPSSEEYIRQKQEDMAREREA